MTRLMALALPMLFVSGASLAGGASYAGNWPLTVSDSQYTNGTYCLEVNNIHTAPTKKFGQRPRSDPPVPPTTMGPSSYFFAPFIRSPCKAMPIFPAGYSCRNLTTPDPPSPLFVASPSCEVLHRPMSSPLTLAKLSVSAKLSSRK